MPADGIVFIVFGSDGPAIGAIHDEAAANGGSGFIDAAVHVGVVHRHAPTLLVLGHHVKSGGQVRGEMGRNIVRCLEHDREAATYGIAVRAM